MGYLRPTAIIVGASYRSGSAAGRMDGPHWIDVAHDEARRIFGSRGFEQLVSEVVEGVTNNERSFLIAWDGSKEGWEDSATGDECRARFVAWLQAQAYGDGSSPLNWIEVQYGGDDREAVVLAHSGNREIVDV